MDNKNNNKNNPSDKIGDNITGINPQSIKKDILLFKNDVLGEIKIMEKKIFEKNKESNCLIKEQIDSFEKKINFINEKISSLNDRILGQIKLEEKINTLFHSREKLFDETSTNKIKINLLEKETRESINRIDDIIKESIMYPGIIGLKGKFLNFHQFIDFVLSESNVNNNFREKNIMDLGSYKTKIEKTLQVLEFKIESILSSCNNFTLKKIKDVNEINESSFGLIKEKINDVRIENSSYIIQLEKDTKDLMNEINIVKSLKTDIFSKVDNDMNNMKKANTDIIETFNNYKNEFGKMNENLKKMENSIEKIIIKNLGKLFDEQKIINENIDNLKKENNNDILNNKIKIIVNEQIKTILGDPKLIFNNNFNNNDNEYNNNNYNLINNDIENNKNNKKQGKNIRNNLITKDFTNKDVTKNKMNTFDSHKVQTDSINSPINIDNSDIKEKNIYKNIDKRNYIGSAININNNKKIISINNKNNNNNYSIILNNKINENILLDIKRDNILNVKKNNFKLSRPSKKQSSGNKEDLNNNNNIYNYFEPNLKKFSIVSRNKIKKYKNEIESDNDNDLFKFIKIYKIKKSKLSKNRNSYDKGQNSNLQKFQRLLKIDIKDVDAQLNNKNNTSSSLELLNSDQEIYDRFKDTKAITKENNQNNNKDKFNNNFNKINVLSYPLKNNNNKNRNEESLLTKNLLASKTSNDFYKSYSNKKLKNEFILKSIKNKNVFQNKKINEKNEHIFKKINSDIINFQNDIKNKTQNEFYYKKNIIQPYKERDDSNNKFYNYFIEFGNNNEKNKKNSQRNINNYFKIMLNDDKKINNNKSAKQIKVFGS